VSEHARCTRCGRVLDDGIARIFVGFSVAELEDIAYQTTLPSVRERALCAIGLLDADRERAVRMEIA
jgi:hypothetical protein